MFPKGNYKKQRVKKGQCLYDNKNCFLCFGENNLERHHIFGNTANRKLSERYGLYTYLCMTCHDNITLNRNMETVLKLKVDGQKRFNFAYPDKDFEKIFKVNYLDRSD